MIVFKVLYYFIGLIFVFIEIGKLVKVKSYVRKITDYTSWVKMRKKKKESTKWGNTPEGHHIFTPEIFQINRTTTIFKVLIQKSHHMQQYDKLSIKQWALEDRPREKFMARGLQSLTDAELIAILIGSGSRDESAVELSKRILNSVGNNLHELGKLSMSELKKQKGIGEAKAITIIAAMELGRRRKTADILNKEKISTSQDVANIFLALLSDLPHEEFWILFLNRANKVISKHKVSQGGLAGTVVDIRMIMKIAIDKLATSMILCHNHPSGNLKPSSIDIEITKKIKSAGELLDIPVLDHIIVAGVEFYSFADEGDL